MSEKQRSTNHPASFALGYLLAQTEATINSIVARSGDTLSGPELAGGLGELLLSKASGLPLRSADSMLPVRRTSSGGSKAVEPVAVARRTRSYQSSGIKRYWARHSKAWRSREMKRRMAMGKKKPVRVLSARGRARIVAAQKARWAKAA